MSFNKRLLTLSTLACTGTLVAQNDTALVTDIVATPNYFLVVLFGVMLAIGFQFLLTSLSVAIGVSAIPNLKKTYAHARFGASDGSDNNNDDWNETNDSAATGVVVSSALGIWNVITAAISLFGATALALTLTPVVTTTIAITLGLTIWAVFYLLMFYFEGRMVGTAIGSLIGTAMSGIRAAGDTVKGMFAPSPVSQVQSVADNTIEKLRKEMDATFDTNAISDAIDNFTNKVNKNLDKNLGQVPSYDKIKADLKEVVKSGGSESNPAKWTAIQSAIQTAIDGGDDSDGDDDKGSEGGGDKIAQLKELLAEAKKAAGKGSSNGSGSKGGISKQVKAYQDKVAKYLETAAPEDFDTDKLNENIQKLGSDPRGAALGIAEQFDQVDQDMIVAAISKNTSLDKKQIQGYVDKATSVLSSFSGGNDDGNNGGQGGVAIISNKATNLLDTFQSSVTSFIGGGGGNRSSSRGAGNLQNDFMKMFNNPSDSIDIISKRLDSYDRETLVTTLTNNTSLTQADINNYVGQVETARNQVKDQVQAIKDKANSAMNQTARRAAIEADHARKTAVAASWWLFTAIVASGVAAVFGAITGI